MMRPHVTKSAMAVAPAWSPLSDAAGRGAHARGRGKMCAPRSADHGRGLGIYDAPKEGTGSPISPG